MEEREEAKEGEKKVGELEKDEDNGGRRLEEDD